MIREVIRDVQSVPGKLAQHRDDARKWVRKQVWQAREQGETSLWKLHLQALERAGELVERASELPVLEKVGPNAKGLLQAVEKVTTAPPFPDYDELNVRKIMGSLHELDRFGLLRVQRHEQSHKNRKTVLDAIEREVERRARLAASL
jgi:hypothetical protein